MIETNNEVPAQDVFRELEQRIKDKVPTLMYKGIQPTFDWETAIGYLSHCADNEIGTPVGTLNYHLPVADQIASIQPVKEYIQETMQDVEVEGVDMLVSITQKGEHKYWSDNDALIWCVVGKNHFCINHEDNEEKAVTTPGDLIFVPANVEYTLEPLTPRTCVFFNLTKGE